MTPLIVVLLSVLRGDVVSSTEGVPGINWDSERAQRANQGFRALDDVGEIATGSHFDYGYFVVAVPFYVGRPVQITSQEGEQIADLVQALGDDHIRRNAMRAWETLIELGKAAEPTVVVALESDDWQRCWMAASILGRIGGETSINALIENLRDDGVEHSALSAFLALIEIGEPALAALTKAAESREQQQALYAKTAANVIVDWKKHKSESGKDKELTSLLD
ncbi:MAG: HEAT repeat domain-containing protein [Candidatus Hydrogenedentota bacterium]